LGNAARSIHQGVELGGHLTLGAPSDVSVEPAPAFGTRTHPELAVDFNATLGDNHFVEYRESYGPTPADQVSYDGNAIGFFPATMGNLAVRSGWRGATLGLEAQYAGRIYVDNNESKDASIAPRAVLNLNGTYRIPVGAASARLGLRVFNLLDEKY